MQTFFDWFRNSSIDQTVPWLILGKGPSFAKRYSYDLSQFHTISLNHAVREQRVKVAHVIDYEVIEDCAEAIKSNAEVLVAPWRPHINFLPSSRNLAELIQTSQVLRSLDEQGRLLWYNFRSAPEREGNSPVVGAEFFSAEAALDLLAKAGARTIRSLGVDGGASYSAEFDDLKDKTLLSCGHASFDKQFKGFAKTILATGVDYAPMDIEAPIRIYVGATEAEMVPCKVLEYSIRKHASMSVEVTPLYQSNIEIPQPKDLHNRPRTPFSFQRFLIPELAGHKGSAIYLDSDMLVFDDIRKIWIQPLENNDLLTVRNRGLMGQAQFSVMLLNCATLDWDIRQIVEALDKGLLSYEQLMFEMAVATRVTDNIHQSWNSLDHFAKGKTSLLHYTNMKTQPWLSRSNPFGHLWMKELFEAMDRGYISLTQVEEHIRLGYIRPSLLYQVHHRIVDSRDLSRRACELDRYFASAHLDQRAGVARRGVQKFRNFVSHFGLPDHRGLR
jgi:hypothetical protein